MKVLVVGSDPGLEAMGHRLVGAPDFSLVRVENGAQAAAELRREPSAFDHIVYGLDGEESLPEALALIRHIEPRPSLTLVSPEQPPAARPHRPAQLVGAFERSPKGLRALNCNLANPIPGPPEVTDIIYEYQAPCRHSRKVAG